MSPVWAFCVGTGLFLAQCFAWGVVGLFFAIVEAFIPSDKHYYDSTGSGRIDTDTYHYVGAIAVLLSFWTSLFVALNICESGIKARLQTRLRSE